MDRHCCTTLLTFILVLLGLVSRCYGTPVRPYQTTISDDERQEIASLAAKILRTALAGSYLSEEKRNAGTIDSLYNLPHLFAAGRSHTKNSSLSQIENTQPMMTYFTCYIGHCSNIMIIA